MQARERTLALVVGSVVGLWLVDVLAVEPSLAWYRSIREDTAKTERTVAEARILIARADRIHAEWRGQHAAGLLDDEGSARFRLQQTLASGARNSGLTMESVGGGQRLPAVHGTAYDTIRSAVSGQGTLKEVLAFLAALQDADMPLRIERCELASRDGRKDQLDLALTISTRIASNEAAKTRKIPAQQTPWKSAVRETADDLAILKIRPFQSDHRSDSKTTTASAKPAAAIAAKPSGLALVGLVTRTGSVQAFMRDLDGGGDRQVVVGESLGEAKITAIDATGVHVKDAEGERLIAIGSTLNGQPFASEGTLATARSGESNSSGTASPANSPSATSTPAADADREAILQRLRHQRSRNR